MTQEIFDEFGNDPFALYRQWLAEAEAQEANDPDAACLATATPDGKPSARMVLVKDINEDKGIKFHTNAESRKGEELMLNPFAALCIHWKSLRKQIRIEGRVEKTSAAESDTYFLTRPPARQIGAWASQQSRSFETRAELEDAIAHYEDKFKDVDQIPRPDYWSGFHLIPANFEFWIGQRDRVHTRFVYTLDDNGVWTASWLYP